MYVQRLECQATTLDFDPVPSEKLLKFNMQKNNIMRTVLEIKTRSVALVHLHAMKCGFYTLAWLSAKGQVVHAWSVEAPCKCFIIGLNFLKGKKKKDQFVFQEGTQEFVVFTFPKD